VSRPTILIGESRFSERARAVLEQSGTVLDFESREAFTAHLPQAEGVVLGLEVQLRDELLASAAKLRVVASRTSQLRHIDLDETRRRGIDVLWIEPDAPVIEETTSTAELTIGLLLGLVRNIPWAMRSVEQERWERFGYGGTELRGKTIGLVGFGRLGRMVARYAQALELRVLASDVSEKRGDIEAAGAIPVTLEELLRESDVVSLHCTWSEETRGLIGAAELALMRRGAVLVNTARGEIVDESALLEALESGRLAGAAIDTLAGEQPDGSHVAGNPLVAYARTHENLIIVPHLGGATADATERTQVHISERLAAWLQQNP
jgi:D-3-phosphoglycerate dehydrogenase